MDRINALTFLLALLETAYHKQKNLFGSSFCHDFIDTFTPVYSNFTRPQYMKAVSVIGNYKFRNKMINILDTINRKEQICQNTNKDDLIPMHTALMQFSWVLDRFRDNKTSVAESLLKKGKTILTRDEYSILTEIVS